MIKDKLALKILGKHNLNLNKPKYKAKRFKPVQPKPIKTRTYKFYKMSEEHVLNSYNEFLKIKNS